MTMERDEAVRTAHALLLAGRRAEFDSFVATAAERFPSDSEMCMLHAMSLKVTEPDRAAWRAAEAVALDIDDPAMLIRAASLLYDVGQQEAAKSYVARAAELCPENFIFAPELVNLGGKLAADEGENDLAEEALSEAVALEPDRASFAAELARFLAQQGRLAEARSVVESALARAPEEPRLLELQDKLSDPSA